METKRRALEQAEEEDFGNTRKGQVLLQELLFQENIITCSDTSFQALKKNCCYISFCFNLLKENIFSGGLGCGIR